MRLLNDYISFWRQTFNYKDRISRQDFWWTGLAVAIPFLILYGLSFNWWFPYAKDQITSGNYVFPLPPLFYVINLTHFLPGLSFNIRRLNDIGKKWTWILIYLIPKLGPQWFLCFQLRPSYDKDQRYLIEKPFFNRRISSSPESIALVFLLLNPIASIIYGIRQRSAEIAFLPLGASALVKSIVQNIFYFSGGFEDNISFARLAWTVSAQIAAAITAFIVAKNNQKDALKLNEDCA